MSMVSLTPLPEEPSRPTPRTNDLPTELLTAPVLFVPGVVKAVISLVQDNVKQTIDRIIEASNIRIISSNEIVSDD